MEPEIEEVYDAFGREDQLTYLSEIGNLYTRLGRNDKVSTYLAGLGHSRSNPKLILNIAVWRVRSKRKKSHRP